VAATTDGSNFLVAWEDRRGASADVYAAWVSHLGTVWDANGVAISTNAANEQTPALAAQGAGKMLVAYSEYDPSATTGSYRARGRLIQPDALLGTACGGAATCASRLCVDGVCCDSPCTGTCQACNVAGSAGRCSAIVNADDPGLCDGTKTCGAGG